MVKPRKKLWVLTVQVCRLQTRSSAHGGPWELSPVKVGSLDGPSSCMTFPGGRGVHARHQGLHRNQAFSLLGFGPPASRSETEKFLLSKPPVWWFVTAARVHRHGHRSCHSRSWWQPQPPPPGLIPCTFPPNQGVSCLGPSVSCSPCSAPGGLGLCHGRTGGHLLTPHPHPQGSKSPGALVHQLRSLEGDAWGLWVTQDI